MEWSFELILASAFTVLCILLALIYRHVCKLYTYFDKLEISGPVPSFLLGTWKEAPEKAFVSGQPLTHLTETTLKSDLRLYCLKQTAPDSGGRIRYGAVDGTKPGKVILPEGKGEEEEVNSDSFLGDLDVENAKLYGKVYGTFDGLTPNLMVIEPDIIKHILLTHADKFDDRRVTSCKNPILKKCLSTLYGEEDNEVRAITNTLLPDSKIKLLPRLESSATTLVDAILKRKEDGVGFNFITVVNDYIHDLIALMIFGIDLNSDIAFKEEFVSYCDQIFTTKNPNSKLSLVPILYENLEGDSWILPQRALNYFVNLIKSGINDTPKDPVLTEGKTANFIEILVEAAEEEKKLMKGLKENESDLVFTEEFIIVKCLSAILALVNTTQSIVLLTIQCLGNQLEVQDELAREVEKNKSEKLSVADLQNIQILDMVIAEVLRLYPSEFRMEKICKDNVTIDKFNFVKGNRVSIPLFALHRQEEYYHEQDKFDPRRFTQEAIENRNPFTYLPFGQAGVNSYSISTRLALLAAKISIFKLVEKLKFKSPDNSNRIFFKKGITGVPKLAALNITTEVKNFSNGN